MTEAWSVEAIGAYCRDVERHLTRANGGHLVRVVGPGFELVRQWALDGVPLSVVYRAIDDKAERHRERGSPHPLRIEFCEADVRLAFDHWRRAVGVAASAAPDAADPSADDDAGGGARRPSLSKHLDRAIDRLTRVAGQVDLPERLRDAAVEALDAATALRDEACGARGPRRQAVVDQLPPIDQRLVAAARAAAGADLIDALSRQAERDLAPYRGRIRPDDWRAALDVTVDRLLRERFGLPTLELP